MFLIPWDSPRLIHFRSNSNTGGLCLLKRILALLADGTDYVGELASYLNSRSDFIFKSVIFNSINELKKFMKEYSVEMILCNESFRHEIPSDTENVCFLSEDGEVMETFETEESRWHRVFKYQSSETIKKDITDYYNRKQRKTLEEIQEIEARKRIVCVCSPIGGCYSSTFALALAQYYSLGGKTLFISFDPFFEYPGEEKNMAEKNLTDLMYFIQAGEPGLAGFIGNMAMRRNSLDYLSGVSHWFDIQEISRETMHTLIEFLNSSCDYENIVFDMRIMGGAGIELLAGSKTVYLLKRYGYNASRAVDEWKRQIRFANYSSILEKTRELVIPHDELLEGNYDFDILLKGHLGQFIEELEGLRYCR